MLHHPLSVSQEYQMKSHIGSKLHVIDFHLKDFLLQALCSSCCNMKFLLPYMDNKEGRVCQVCCNALLRGNQVTIFQFVN